MRRLALIGALSVLSVPSAAQAKPYLSRAQGRWFVERAVHPWRPNAVYGTCKRLSTTTVACPAYVRLSDPFGTTGPLTRVIELVEFGTDSHVTVILGVHQGIGPGAA